MNSIEEFNNSKDKNFINNFRIKYYLGNVDKEIVISKKKYIPFDDELLLNEENHKSREIMEINLKKYYDKYVFLNKYFDTRYIEYSCYFKDFYTYLNNYYKETNKKKYRMLILFWRQCKI